MGRKKGAIRKDSAEEPKPEVKAEEPKPEPKVKKPYVTEGRAITSRKGILGPGVLVKPEYFGPEGDATLAHLISSGKVELK